MVVSMPQINYYERSYYVGGCQLIFVRIDLVAHVLQGFYVWSNTELVPCSRAEPVEKSDR